MSLVGHSFCLLPSVVLLIAALAPILLEVARCLGRGGRQPGLLAAEEMGECGEAASSSSHEPWAMLEEDGCWAEELLNVHLGL